MHLRSFKTQTFMYPLLSATLLVLVLLLFRTSEAAPNYEINYQGKLTDSTNVAVPDGTYNMRFWLLTSPTIATTSALWTESLTGTNKVQVTNGLFSVMLGSTSPLTGVDFSQTLYLGVEIGGSTTPQWDGEMSPRKILGTVPAAFVASTSLSANTLDGLDSTQFVRTDATSTIVVNTPDSALSITQNGAGYIFDLYSGVNPIFVATAGGKIGIATTTPIADLSIDGDFALTGGIYDNTYSLGSNGQILTTTGSGVAWSSSLPNLTVTTGTTTYATSSTLYTTTLGLGSQYFTSLLGSGLSNVGGVLTASGDGVSNWSYNGTRLTPTSTTAGIVVNASSTIGGGTGATGLTIYGGATTTGNAYFGGRVSIGSTSPSSLLTISNSVNTPGGTPLFTIASTTGGTATTTLFSVGAGGSIGIGGATNGLGLGTIISGQNTLTSTNTLEHSMIFGMNNSVASISYFYTSSLYGNSNSFSDGAYLDGSSLYGSTNIFSNDGNLTMSSLYGNNNTFPNNSSLSYSSLYGYNNTFSENVYFDQTSLYGSANTFSGDSTLAFSSLFGDNNLATSSASILRSALYGQYNSASSTATLTDSALFGSYNTLLGNLTTGSVIGSTNMLGSGDKTGLFIYGDNNTATGTITNALLFGSGNTLDNVSNLFAFGNSLSTVRSNFATFGNLFNVDSASSTVGVGTTTPVASLSIVGTTTRDVFNVASSSGATLLRVLSGGNVGIGTTTPSQLLSVAGGMHLTGGLYDRTATSGNPGMVLQTTGSGVQWVSTSSLGISGASTLASLTDVNTSGVASGTVLVYDVGTAKWETRATSSLGITSGTSLFTDGGNITYLTDTTEHLSLGTTSARALFTVSTSSATTTATFAQYGAGDILNLLSAGTEVMTFTASGRLGLGTTTPTANLAITGTAGQTASLFRISSSTEAILFEILADGSVDIGRGGFYYDASTNETSIAQLNLGSMNFGTDAGVVSWVDMPVVSAPANTIMSYSAQLDENPVLTVYGESNGSGGVQNLRVGIGSTSPIATLGVLGSGNSSLFSFASSTGSTFLTLNTKGVLTFGSTTADNIFINGGPTSTPITSLISNNIAIGNQAYSYASTTSLNQNNIALGYQALYGSSSVPMTADNNIAIGKTALFNSTSAYENIALGNEALFTNTSGGYNVGIGLGPLYYNTTGSYNNAIGNSALRKNVSGSNNNAFGYTTMWENTTGSGNNAFGDGALYSNTTGKFNNVLGYWALSGYVGTGTIGIGYFAGNLQTQGDNNIILGYRANVASTTGNNQLSIGNIIYANELGNGGAVSAGNVSIGTATPWAKFSIQNNYGSTTALFDIATTTSASYATSSLFRVGHDGKVGIGSSTPSRLLTVAGTGYFGSDLTVVGTASTSALVVSNSIDLFGGGAKTTANALCIQLTGSADLCDGSDASGAGGTQDWIRNASLTAITPTTTTLGIVINASSTIGDGTGAGGLTITGGATTTLNAYIAGTLGLGTTSPSAKLAVTGTAGSQDLFRFASSSGSSLLTLRGDGRLMFGTTTSANIFLNGGPTSTNPLDSSNTNNIALGNEAFSFVGTGATDNIALGYQALYGSSSVPMTGTYNIAIGKNALLDNTEGYENIAVGFDSLANNTTGYANVGLGKRALLSNLDGGYNIALGENAMRNSVSGQQNVAFGPYALYQNTTGSYNSALGLYALQNNTTGTNNVALGDNSDVLAGDLTNAIVIGAKAKIGRSNTLVLGGTGTYNVDVVTGSTTPWAKFSIMNNYGSTTALFDIATTTSASFATSSLFRVGYDGRVSIGSTTPEGIGLTINRTNLSGALTAGLKEYFQFNNSVENALYYGDNTYIVNTPTATSTLIGSIIRVQDSSQLGNVVRGLEVQAHRGTTTKGENTGVNAFGRTFGIRGTTEGDAGDTYVPAGVFAETRGTTQGQALRAYSGSITTAALVSLFQDTSAFTGTGLQMNFGNGNGSFAATSSTAKFFDLQVAGTSKFIIAANGSTTIGDGTVNAGLIIPRGGICVDNDGSCISTTTGQIRSVTSALGNSDLAEMYFSSEPLETGEIVSLAGGLSIGRASEASAHDIIGVVSTKPGMTLGYDDTSLKAGESAYPIALKGRVPIRLSTENGPIMKGDRIALSSIPGIGMKATESATIVGIALEDFDGEKAYSAGYLNQFGDDMVKVKLETNKNVDPRTQDGCSYGAGNEEGEAPCEKNDVDPIKPRTISIDERTAALNELRDEEAEMLMLDGTEVHIGQALMFVQLGDYIIPTEQDILAVLNATSTLENGEEDETLFDRLVALANRFVDGVLTMVEVVADRFTAKEVKTDVLCVGNTCVDEATLKALLQAQRQSPLDVTTSPTSDEESTSNGASPTPEENGGGSMGDTPLEVTVPPADEIEEPASNEASPEPTPTIEEPTPEPETTTADAAENSNNLSNTS